MHAWCFSIKNQCHHKVWLKMTIAKSVSVTFFHCIELAWSYLSQFPDIQKVISCSALQAQADTRLWKVLGFSIRLLTGFVDRPVARIDWGGGGVRDSPKVDLLTQKVDLFLTSPPLTLLQKPHFWPTLSLKVDLLADWGVRRTPRTPLVTGLGFELETLQLRYEQMLPSLIYNSDLRCTGFKLRSRQVRSFL